MRYKHQGFALWGLIAGLTGQVVIIGSSFYLGVDYGKTLQESKHTQETEKLTLELNTLKKQSREKVSETQRTQDAEVSGTDVLIRDGIKQGGWGNEDIPQDAVDVIWGSTEQ